DKYGRPLVAYADGCIDKCVHDAKVNSKANRGYILRQTTGRGLFAAYDAPASTTHPKKSGVTTRVREKKTTRRLAATGAPSWPVAAGFVLVGCALAVRRWKLSQR